MRSHTEITIGHSEKGKAKKQDKSTGSSMYG